MNTKKIVFVCFDNDYITALEFKMAEIVGNSADIEFITDVIYFQQYMSIPRRIDILVMPEGMKEALTNKVNVGKILYLTDEILQEEQDDLVYKYGSVRYLVEKIDNKIFDNAEKDIKKGKAYILTELEDNEIKKYEIYITKINTNGKVKNITFKITDERLLEIGGIVQGMSGSPIIQGDYIVGAVTHVVVENPKKGYGILITNMLEEAEKKDE